MAGRRLLSLTAIAAAFVLFASTGTSWAHPGNGHGHAYGHAHATHSDGSTANGPFVVGAGSSTGDTTGPTYRTATRHGHAYGNTLRGLAAHRGKALGLFKRMDRPSSGSGQPPSSPPPPPTTVGGEPPAHPQPAAQPPASNPAHSPPAQDGSSSTPPPTTAPPPQRPPTDQDPAGLAQVLLHSNPARFTALPIVIISVLLLGVCGLIGLARHRA